eukprot:8528029-Karenia_brevis.AAC.1
MTRQDTCDALLHTQIAIPWRLMHAVLKMKAPNLFMIFDMCDSSVRVLSNLLFLDDVSAGNLTLQYPSKVKHHMALHGSEFKSTSAVRVPAGCKNVEYWQALLSKASTF